MNRLATATDASIAGFRSERVPRYLAAHLAFLTTMAVFECVRQLSRLCHPNTIAIFDYGRRPDGVLYYAMEYLEGVNLRQLVEREGPQVPGRVIHIAAQASYALAEAHEVGLVHRDVKPANIVLSRRGGVPDLAKVVDFGLVKDVRTPSLAQSVDARTYIYALGAVADYLLTGRFIFEGSSLVEVFGKHIHTPPRPPSQLDAR